jgi:competence protein ComEC
MRPVRPKSECSLADTWLEIYPLLVAAIALITGAALCASLNSQLRFSTRLILPIIVIFSIAILCLNKWWKPTFFYRSISLLLLIGLFFFLGFLLKAQSAPATPIIPNFIVGKPWKFTGRVIRTPKQLENNRAYAWIELISMGNGSDSTQLTSRVILFYSTLHFSDIRERDTLVWDGRLRKISPKPKLETYFRWLKRNRIYLQANVTEPHRIGRPKDWRSWFQDLQLSLRLFLAKQLPNPDERRLSEALLIGVRSDLEPELKNAFARSGLSHLLALSGAHVGILLWLIMAVRSFMAWHPLGRILTGITLVVVLLFFPVLTGLSPSVVRACLMALLYLIARLLYRPQPLLQVLALTAILQFVYDPELIHHLGFQLTYAAMLGIGLLQPPLRSLAKPIFSIIYFKNNSSWFVKPIRKIGRTIVDILVLSFAAQLFTAPLVLFHFGTFPLYFMLANVLAWPIAFVALTSGFALLLVQFSDWLVFAVSLIHQLALRALIEIARWISNFPFAQLEIPELPEIYFFSIFLLIIVFGVFWHMKEQSYRLKRA